MKPICDWESHKVVIALLYQNQKRPLAEVMKIMARDHAFIASPKQYKDQLKKWDMIRNFNKTDVAMCLYALQDIERENRSQRVLLRGREITRADIIPYLKKSKQTEEQLLLAYPPPSDLPPQVAFAPLQTHPLTPGAHFSHHPGSSGLSPAQAPGQTTPSWTWSSQPSKMQTPRSTLSNRTSLSSIHMPTLDVSAVEKEEQDLHQPPFHIQHSYQPDRVAILSQPSLEPWTLDDPMRLDDDMVSEHQQAAICATVSESADFAAIVDQTIAPRPRSGLGQANSALFSFISATPPQVFQSDKPQSLVPTTQQAWAGGDGMPDQQSQHLDLGPVRPYDASAWFLSKCFNACIVQGQGFHEQADRSVREAIAGFQDMVAQRDNQCLTTLNLLTTFLEAHGQRHLAESILQGIMAATVELLSREHPICVSIHFMAEIVAGQARHSQYDVGRLRAVHRGLVEMWGPDSPSALTGLYHLAWRLALKKETCQEAWPILEALIVDCEQALGRCHMQTISCMVTAARVLYHLDHSWKAACTINRAIERLGLMYEDYHPYRLEARSRQATLLMKLDLSFDIETILQDVVVQQAAVLGFQNPRTVSTLRNLQDFLKSRGRAVEADNLPEYLRTINMNEQFQWKPTQTYHEPRSTPAT